MELTKKTIKLVCELEYIIGDECYNPNSFDGWTLEEGRAFRYPVTYNDECNIERKIRYKVENIDEEQINTMRYKFGSNNLFIGSAIVKVLQYLEDEYNLDFDELVKNKK